MSGRAAFDQIPGNLKTISVGADGAVWGIGSAGQVFRFNGAAFIPIEAALVIIAVGNTNAVWGINSSNQVFRWDGAALQMVGGALTNISVGADGDVWGINSSNQVFHWDGAVFQPVAGALTAISVGTAGAVWGLNASNHAFQWDGAAFDQVAGALLTNISVGADGAVWGINSSNHVFQWQSGAFQEVGGALTGISVGAAGAVWGINSSNHVFQWDGAVLQPVAGALTGISVGAAGAVWGLDSTGQVYRLNAASAQLEGQTNYYLFDSTSPSTPLTGVSVTINVTEDIVCAATSDRTVGFAFQLNAYSPNTQTAVGWQQYCIIVWDNGLKAMINNWPPAPPPHSSGLINDTFDLISLPSPRIPAGYSLTISLVNGSGNAVVGAIFTVVDNSGKQVVNWTETLLGKFLNGVTITSAELAPIVAFQLDFVGPVNGESAVLSSGAGTISYSASNVLTASTLLPTGAVGSPTGEYANTVYGALPASPSAKLTQSFGVSPVEEPATFDQITFSIGTGSDDLRGDSSATASVVLPNGSQTFTLKAQSDPGWGNGSNNARTFPIAGPPQVLPSFGAITITLTSHNSFGETDDNWNIQYLQVTVDGPSGNNLLCNQSGNPLARLTGSAPSVTLQPEAGA